MSHATIQELRIAALHGLQIPEGITEGDTITVTATLQVSKIDQEWIDVTTIAGKPEQLAGATTVCTVATSTPDGATDFQCERTT